MVIVELRSFLKHQYLWTNQRKTRLLVISLIATEEASNLVRENLVLELKHAPDLKQTTLVVLPRLEQNYQSK